MSDLVSVSQLRQEAQSTRQRAGKTSTCPGCGAKVTCPDAAHDAEVVEMGPPPAKPSGFDPFGDLDDDKPIGVAGPSPAAESAAESRRPCPKCGEMILTTAAKCRFCGEVFDSTLKKAKKSGGKKAGLKKIAALQKYLLISILVFIVSYIALFAAAATMQPSPAGPPKPGGSTAVIVLLLFLVVMVASLVSWVLSVLLANKMYGTGPAVLVFFLQFVPCVNLITLLVVNNKATNLLRDKGYTVGFLGADLSDFG